MTRLVLLPGLDGTGDLFEPFVRELQGVPHQVVAYPTDRVLDYAGHEAHVRARLPTDEDYVLLAESFSGPVGIAIAASAPPRLRGLILCVSFAANPLPMLGGLSRLIAILPAIKLHPALAGPWLHGGRASAELRRALAAVLSKVSARVLRTRVAELLAVDRVAQLRKIEVPMLYMRARQDRLVPAAAGRKILELRPDVELVEFDAPHLLLQIEPAKCAAAVLDFMRRRCS